MNGYESNDAYLPNYRKVWSEIELTAEFPYGTVRSFPVVLPDNADPELKDEIYHHKVIEPITIVEQNIKGIEESVGYIHLPARIVRILAGFYTKMVEGQGGTVRKGHRTVGKTQLMNIVELTKQKLLDTLQELETEFPELDRNYTVNEENNKKVKNIITNNIYGNNNPVNLAAGETVSQSNVSIIIGDGEREKLKELGVEEEAIQELEVINNENPKGNEERKKKIMAWLGRVTASLASRGIYEKIPNLVEFVDTII